MKRKQTYRASNQTRYQGDNLAAAQAVLAQLYPKQTITWIYDNKAPFKYLIHTCQANALNISYLEFTHNFHYRTQVDDQCTLLIIHLSGDSTFTTELTQFQGNAQQPIILNEHTHAQVTCSSNCKKLEICIPNSLFYYHVYQWLEKEKFPDLYFSPTPNLQNKLTALTTRKFIASLNFLKLNNRRANTPIAELDLENTFINDMLMNYPNNLYNLLHKPQHTTELKRILLVEEFIRKNTNRKIEMAQLAEIASCSVSSLSRAFKKYRPYTPFEFLTHCRLEQAYTYLSDTRESSTVSEVALACGFTHLGRFAKIFKHTFGTAPSEILKSAHLDSET
ncbi:helix-turn-helix transcriptional regulator [Catenovulum sediminis]|uniref:Helix-turn-helix transcriptional regulator n=1 Tax=Catenovulum sediminis TaxID=1740262 RepID=A0ABV1RCI0_9ALTE|nr:helix-turn-helix transcriptional regulator [Catenovulum sediminis]